jgi:hypothetical protein
LNSLQPPNSDRKMSSSLYARVNGFFTVISRMRPRQDPKKSTVFQKEHRQSCFLRFIFLPMVNDQGWFLAHEHKFDRCRPCETNLLKLLARNILWSVSPQES